MLLTVCNQNSIKVDARFRKFTGSNVSERLKSQFLPLNPHITKMWTDFSVTASHFVYASSNPVAVNASNSQDVDSNWSKTVG